MKTRILLQFLLLLVPAASSFAQDFSYGVVSLSDLAMSKYERDTGASAVVLKEFGEAYIGNDEDYNLIFKYHARIKILTKNGLSQSDIEIPLFKDGSHRQERITSLKASAFNLENGRLEETVLQDKNIFNEDRNK